MKKSKIEASKKIIIFLSACFILSLIYGIIIFTYSIISEKIVDYTFLITMVTTTGTALCASVVFYFYKARIENVYKIKKSFLKEKYVVLKKAGMLSEDYAQQELMNEVQSIDLRLDEEEDKALMDLETKLDINL